MKHQMLKGIFSLVIICVGTGATAQVTSTRLHRDDESNLLYANKFSDRLNGFASKWQAKLLHHSFCPMLSCHSSCAESDNPCGYAMFHGSILKANSNSQGCAAGHHGQDSTAQDR